MFGSPIREATELDYGVFVRLWVDYIDSQARLGGDLLPTPKTLAFFTAVFNSYVQHERRGVVLLAGEADGVSLWGEDLGDSILDSRYDPYARGWGTYIVPSRRREGLGSAMREHGCRRMMDMGFKNVTGVMFITNDVSIQSLKKYETHTPMMIHVKALEEL